VCLSDKANLGLRNVRQEGAQREAAPAGPPAPGQSVS
jgi:hypothetical protein